MKRYSVEDILTWGLKLDDKFGGYKLPVSFKYHDDVVRKIEKTITKEVASKNIEDINQMSQDDLYEYVKYLTLKSKDIVKEFTT